MKNRQYIFECVQRFLTFRREKCDPENIGKITVLPADKWSKDFGFKYSALNNQAQYLLTLPEDVIEDFFSGCCFDPEDDPEDIAYKKQDLLDHGFKDFLTPEKWMLSDARSIAEKYEIKGLLMFLKQIDHGEFIEDFVEDWGY